MPVDRTVGADLAQALVDMYAEAQQRIAVDIARRLKAGLARSEDAHRQLIAVGELRRAIQAVLAKLAADTTGEVEQTLVLAYARGGKAALEEIARLGNLGPQQLAELRRAVPGVEAIQRLAWALASSLLGTHVRILRWALDTYRDVIARTALPGVLLGTDTRLRAAQRAWEEFLSRGVTGFVDKAGRHWELASYVEMAVRTGAAQAAVQGHLDRLGDAGIDLVIVSNAPQECVKCRPWEGKVLTRMPAGRKILARSEHAINDGEPVVYRIAGSVAEAVAAGLLHPNCRHSLSAFLPGVTRQPRNTADPEGDKARQELRALERRVRKAKLQAAAALDADAKRRWEARIREIQAEIRDHLDEHTDLFRQRHREQIGQAR